MGTNYYAQLDVCESCGHPAHQLHIGKSSMGWCFSLHMHPECGLETWDNWVSFLKGKRIVDEYGSKISRRQFMEIVTKRRGNVGKGPPPFKFPVLSRSENSRYQSWDEFAAETHGFIDHEFNLLRHVPCAGHVVGHGPGPYDYLVGDFS